MGVLPFTVLHSADASFYTNGRSAATLLSSKSIGALIPTAFPHFVPVSLATLTVFQTLQKRLWLTEGSDDG